MIWLQSSATQITFLSSQSPENIRKHRMLLQGDYEKNQWRQGTFKREFDKGFHGLNRQRILLQSAATPITFLSSQSPENIGKHRMFLIGDDIKKISGDKGSFKREFGKGFHGLNRQRILLQSAATPITFLSSQSPENIGKHRMLLQRDYEKIQCRQGTFQERIRQRISWPKLTKDFVAEFCHSDHFFVIAVAGKYREAQNVAAMRLKN